MVLVGHSAGASAVRWYAAENQDARVVGVVLASGGVGAAGPADSDQLAQATRLILLFRIALGIRQRGSSLEAVLLVWRVVAGWRHRRNVDHAQMADAVVSMGPASWLGQARIEHRQEVDHHQDG